MRLVRIAVIAAVVTAAFVGSAEAGPVLVGTNCPDPIGGYGRQMTMTGVLSPCYFAAPASGTPQASDIATYFGGIWTKEGEVKASTVNGVNDLLTITSSGWGNDATGTWSIAPSFWSTWGHGVISVHVGNGPADSYVANPDWFLFEVTPGGLGGNFEYHKYLGQGGGLSNFFLWGSGVPEQFDCGRDCTVTPEPASLLLLGTGLIALAARLRRRKV